MKTNRCWNQIGTWGAGTCPELTAAVHCRNCPVHAQAAVELLDRDLPAGYRSEAEDRFTLAMNPPARGDSSAVIFRVGPEWLALPTMVFKEVCEMRPIHSLPHLRGGVVRGIVNVRGELLVCISLSALLSIPEDPGQSGGSRTSLAERLLVAGDDDERVVFPVQEVHGIHRFAAAQLLEAPATVCRVASTFTRALLSWRGHPVGLLDHKLLFGALHRSMS